MSAEAGATVASVRALALVVTLGLAGAPAGSAPPPAVAPKAPAVAPTAPGAEPKAAAPKPDAASSTDQPSGAGESEPDAGAANAKLPGATLGAARTPAAVEPPAPKDPAARRDWLRARLDEVFGAAALAGAKMSILVVESDSDKLLYARGEKALLNAASNVKIATTAAALALLGPEYRWKTVAYAPGQSGSPWLGAGGELHGDLYVKGFGDPVLSAQDLSALAGDLSAHGLRRVRGALIVDESFFGHEHVGPAFDQRNDSAAFRAPSSATSLNGNVVAVTTIPATKAGTPARIVLDPPTPYLVVKGAVATVEKSAGALTVETAAEGDTRTAVTVSGGVRVGTEPRTIYRRVVHPDQFFAQTLRQLLAGRGIGFDRPMRLGVVPTEGVRVVASHDSPPLAVVAHELGKRSNNFVAEQVMRTVGAEMVGRPGTWEKGAEAIARWLEAVGIPRGSYRLQNGSGLYDSNRLSAEQIVTVLRAALRDFRIASEFQASLALAGADGTVAHRMGGTAAERFVRAKTGTLQGTSCLSGYAASPGQPALVFSILMNDLKAPAEGRKAQDRAAAILVAYLDAAR